MRVGIITWPKWITHKKCHVFFYIVYFSLLYFLQVTTLERDVVSQEINVFSFFFFLCNCVERKRAESNENYTRGISRNTQYYIA